MNNTAPAQEFQNPNTISHAYTPQTSSLLKAAYEGDLNRVRTFLKEGVPVDACNSVSFTIDVYGVILLFVGW